MLFPPVYGVGAGELPVDGVVEAGTHEGESCCGECSLVGSEPAVADA